eukprot:56471_1
MGNSKSKNLKKLLVDGYIRDINKSMNNASIIPSCVNNICLKFYCLVHIDSEILNHSEANILLTLLNESNKKIGSKFKLIYRASRDGWSGDDFYNYCYNKSKTMIIIHTDSDNIFGGYASKAWKRGGGYKPDDNAFLFLIRSSKNYKPQIFDLRPHSKQYAIEHVYSTKSYLFIFGGGNDIRITANCNSNKDSCTNATRTHSYDIPQPFYLNGGKQYFGVKEIETFRIL